MEDLVIMLVSMEMLILLLSIVHIRLLLHLTFCYLYGSFISDYILLFVFM